MKISEIIRESRRENDPDITYQSEPTKVTATVSDVISQKYTRLANNLKKLEELSNEIKRLQEEVKQQRREDVIDLFDVEDQVLTRVVETRSIVLTLSKDPKPTVSPQYKKILEELEKSLTPELITVLEVLKKEHVTITQKEPSLRIDVKEDKGNDVLSKIKRWLPNFDRRLDNIIDKIGDSKEPTATIELEHIKRLAGLTEEDIHEIRGGGLASPQLPSDKDFSSSKIIATVDGYDIHAFRYLPMFEIVLAILDENGRYKGYIGFSEDGHFIEANTLEQHRRKGIMSVLLLYALRNVKSPLYINDNDIVSRFSRAAIRSLSEKNIIYVTDENNNRYDKEKLLNILNDNWTNEYSLYLYPTHKELNENYWEFRDVDTKEAYYNTNFLGESIKPYWYN